MKDPMGMTERYLYDTAGNMVTKYDRNGTELRYDYDGMNRITKEYAIVGGGEVLKSTYSYNGMNNLAEMNDGKSAISYWYNGNNMLGNMYVHQNGKKYQISIGYDDRGNLTTKYISQYIKSEYVEENKIVYKYTYDKNNNLTKVKYRDCDETKQLSDLVSYTYDNMDRPIKEERGDITTEYVYNMAGLVTGMTNKNGSSVISTYSNTYNYDGNVAKAVENGNTTTYTYDYMNRLVSEDNIYKKYEYEYDGAGNRIRMECNDKNYEDSGTEYTYDKNNRLIEEVEFVYSADEKHITDYKYDKNGNMLTKVKSIADTTSYERKQSLGIKTASELSKEQESEYFTYNVFNQLKGYRDTEGTSAKYEYMPNNYRYEKTVGGVKTRFLWDGDYVIGELDSTGNISKKYFYGKDMISDNSGNNYVYDIHGSVTNILNSSGTKTGTYEYNAFGNVEKVTGSTAQPWQYCGEYKDNETGLIYLRNRYYDTASGRFITEDPVKDGLNWYAYCGGNPVSFFDWNGLKLQINNYKELSSNSESKYYINRLQVDLNRLLMDGTNNVYGTVNISESGNITLDMNVENCSLPGYILLKKLIDAETVDGEGNYSIDVLMDSKEECSYDSKTNIIKYNPDTDAVALLFYDTVDNRGKLYRQYAKAGAVSSVSLAHELIHAYRDETGQKVDSEVVVKYTGITPHSEGKRTTVTVNAEEFETVGLVGWSVRDVLNNGYYKNSPVITENMIREQLGYPKRGWYEKNY